MKGGAFRLDLYMRLCSDRIRTPSLRAVLDAAPGERRTLVHHIAENVAGPLEADDLTSRLVHRSFRPLALALGDADEEAAVDSEEAAFAQDFREGNLTVAEVVARYTTVVHAQTGSYRKTAERLDVDRRLVPRSIDHALLARLVERRGGEEDERRGSEEDDEDG